MRNLILLIILLAAVLQAQPSPDKAALEQQSLEASISAGPKLVVRSPVTMTITDYDNYESEVEQVLDSHGKPKRDRHGNPKIVHIWHPVQKTVEAYLARVADAHKVGYVERTDYNYQYNYVSPACLNTWWCHMIVGDPTAQATAQPVYGELTVYAFEDATSGDVYIAHEPGSHLLGFAINSTVKYCVDSGGLVVIDNQGDTHRVELVQKILKSAKP